MAYRPFFYLELLFSKKLLDFLFDLVLVVAEPLQGRPSPLNVLRVEQNISRTVGTNPECDQHYTRWDDCQA